MSNLTKNKIRKVNYRAIDFTVGVTDFVVGIIRPDGTNFTPNPTVSAVPNASGLYTFSYTPNMSGVWIEKISSTLNGDNTIQSVVIENYDMDDIRTQLSNIHQGGNFQN
jgi:hypothetical protein